MAEAVGFALIFESSSTVWSRWNFSTRSRVRLSFQSGTASSMSSLIDQNGRVHLVTGGDSVCGVLLGVERREIAIGVDQFKTNAARSHVDGKEQIARTHGGQIDAAPRPDAKRSPDGKAVGASSLRTTERPARPIPSRRAAISVSCMLRWQLSEREHFTSKCIPRPSPGCSP